MSAGVAYVHIPFCARRCPYCDFRISVGREEARDRYVASVVAEIEREADWLPLAAVYFGGGTPSYLGAGGLEKILAALERRFGIAAGAEISLEANPEDWSAALVQALAAAGFTRVSLGAQSLDPSVLRTLGRVHTPEQVPAAVDLARKAGFRSVNLDLIFGTPGESPTSWERTVAKALAADSDHVSCYALTIEPGTEMFQRVAGSEAAPDPDDQADRYEAADRLLSAAGLNRYEVSNWARPGHECRYNQAVWAQGEYAAFGMAAHRFRDGVRGHNLQRLDAYLAAVEAGRSPFIATEKVTGWDREVERVFLGLRRAGGVRAGPAGEALVESAEGRRLVEAGVIALQGERIVVRRPLLTDAAARAVLALPPPDC
jgi:putative oxygen-independent coproporphyrinogen III oxidase